MGDSELFPGVPSWVIPAGLFGVVILAMLSGRSSGGSSAMAQTSYQPTPADPNLTALSATESNNLTNAFKSVVDYVTTTDVSSLAAGRDIALQTMHSQSENQKTSAALAATLAQVQEQQNVAYASDSTLRDVAGIGASTAVIESNNSVLSSRAANDAQIAIARFNSDASVTNATTAANASTAIAGSRENTAKAVSKNGIWTTAINTIGAVASAGGSLLKVFGL